MDNIGSKKERYNVFNSLVSLIKNLENQNIIVDLRDDSVIVGKLIFVDGYLNVTLKNVVLIDCVGLQYGFDEIMLNKRKIRYIHIPSQVQIIPTIGEQISKMSRIKPIKRERKTFKKKRCEDMQQTILKEISKH